MTSVNIFVGAMLVVVFAAMYLGIKSIKDEWIAKNKPRNKKPT